MRSNYNNSDIVTRSKRDLDRDDICTGLEYGSVITEMFADVSTDIVSIPGLREAVAIPAVGVSVVSHIAKSGVGLASTALKCDDIPFDEIKDLIEEKANEIDRKLDKHTEALEKLTDLSVKTFTAVEKLRNEMKEGFERVLDAIENEVVKTKVARIHSIVDHFEGERGRVQGLRKDEYIAMLEEEEGILSYLKETITPKGLRAPLFEILDNDYALPKTVDDETAFRALYSLLYGTDAYVSIMLFLIEQHAYLADNYYQSGKIEEYNKQIDKIVNVFDEFKYALVDKKYGLVKKVNDVLKEAKEKNFISEVKSYLYKRIIDAANALNSHVSKIKSMTLPLIRSTPSIPGITFEEPVLETPIADWLDQRTVRYAVQYEKDGIFSKVGPWSSAITIKGKASPNITVPTSENRNRLIFRKFNNDDSQLVGVLSEEETGFRDINRDFFNAAGNADKDQALVDVTKLLSFGANPKAIFDLGRTSLHAAAKKGNIKVVNFLLENGVTDINTKDNKGYTPIHVAAETGQSDFIFSLSFKGADVNIQTEPDRLTALHIAAKNGYLGTVERLVRIRGINVNLKNKDGYTPLHIAATGPPRVALAFLTDSHLEINAKNSMGLTPLHLAVMHGNPEVVRSIGISKKIDLNAVDINNMTSLHYASMSGNLKIVKYLISKHGIKLNLTAKESLWTPLHVAVFFKKDNVASELIKTNGVDLNASASDKTTPIHLAVATGQTKILNELLDKKVNIEAKTNYGMTPLHVAAFRDKDVARILIESGAKIGEKTSENETVLHFSAFSGKEDVVSYFIEKGADVKAGDSTGQTAAHYAVSAEQLNILKLFIDKDSSLIGVRNKQGHNLLSMATEYSSKEISKYLLSKDSNVNNVNIYGMSPLLYTAKGGQLDIFKLLIKKGADVNHRDKEFNNFFYHAAQNGHLNIVKHAYEKKLLDFDSIDPNRKTFINGDNTILYFGVCDAIKHDKLNLVKYIIGTLNQTLCNPLQTASRYGQLDILQYLIETKKMNVNEESTDSRETALCNVAKSGHVDIAKYLLENKADISKTCSGAATPFYYAIENGHLKIVKLLVSYGSDPNEKGFQNNTPLHIAVRNGRRSIAKFFLEEKEADVNAVNIQLNTPLHIAVLHQDVIMVDYLLSQGANKNVKNKAKKTPLDLAKELKMPTITAILNQSHKKRYIKGKPLPSNYRQRKANAMQEKKSGSWKLGNFKNEIKHDSNFSQNRAAYETLHLMKSPLQVTGNNNNFEKAETFKLRTIDADAMLLLLDVVLRKFNNQNYIPIVNEGPSKLEAQAMALNITEDFERLLESVSNDPVEEHIDLSKLHSKIYKTIVSGKGSTISEVLCSYVENFPKLNPLNVRKLMEGYSSDKIKFTKSNYFEDQLPLKELCLHRV